LFTKIDTYAGVVIENPRMSSDPMFFGVDTVRHECDYSTGRFTTEFVGSGKVLAYRHKWRKWQTRTGAQEDIAPEEIGGGGFVMPEPTGMAVTPGIESLTVYVPQPPVHEARWAATEVQVSTDAGFDPTKTRSATNKATEFTFDSLEGGKLHYIRAAYIVVTGTRWDYSTPVTDTPDKVSDKLDPSMFAIEPSSNPAPS